MLEALSDALPPPASRLLRAGYLAVQSFFVLSGFVLARTYASTRWNRKKLADYAMARFARIYPVYFLSLLIVGYFIVRYLLFAPGGTARTIRVTEYVLLLQGWLPPLGVGWNTPAWSLSCEFVFYLCLPAVAIWMSRGRHGLKILALAAGALFLPTLLRNADTPSTWKPIYHVADFLAGVAIAYLLPLLRRTSVRWFHRGEWLYLPAALAGLAIISYPTLLPGGLEIKTPLRVLNAAALFGLALGGGWVARTLAHPAADYLGKISYSVYILHVPVLWWFGNATLVRRGVPPPFAALAYLSLVVAVSALAYRFVEAPANRWLRSLTRPRVRTIEVEAAAA